MLENSHSMIIDGHKLAKEIIKTKPGLTLGVVQIGCNAVSEKYVNEKKKVCLSQGIDFKFYQLDEADPEIVAEKSKEVSGLIVQLPFPGDVQAVLNSVPVEKDIDMLSEKMIGRYYTQTTKLLPPVVGAIKTILRDIDLKGKRVALFGYGRLVGRPLSIWLVRQKATVTIIHKDSLDKKEICQQADIVISGVGYPNLITADMIKEGAVVIDAGTSVEAGEVKGDVDFKNVVKKASLITPVIGGVGPLTVACLINNLVDIDES